MTSIQAAAGAFRREWQTSTLSNDLTFNSYAARLQRYSVYWAFFKNNAYSDVHTWAKEYRVQNHLYRHVRNIYNPARRLCTFWETALMGGALDRDAGDGAAVKSALPILTTNEALRPAIARLWRDSNMQSAKEEYTLVGSVFGDVGWRVNDDPLRRKIYLTPLRPETLYDVVRDPVGNVKGYTIVETRLDPRVTVNPQPVTYTEVAERDGDFVVYRTLLNDKLYPWDGVQAEWEAPYGFVPIVIIKHSGIGQWGASEIEGNESKIREADDMASVLHDYIRKATNQPMMIAGAKKSEDGSTPTARNANTSDTRVGAAYGTEPNLREEFPFFYAPAGATATTLLATIDIAGAGARIDKVIAEFESDNPELLIDKLRVSGGLTGRALELAREPAEKKGGRLRGNYDDGLVRAHQMAIAIGGWRGYDGYQGFGLDSYARGVLDHTIGEREIFSASPMDQLEYKEKFWQIVVAAGGEPVGSATVLHDLGWTDEKIADEMGEAPDVGAAPAPGAPDAAGLLNEVQSAMQEFRAAMGGAPEPVGGVAA